ncbi:unnamed protein product [Symbiodinium necroappetens]|uniref:Uncharacterized protein n=1 Tax=Symbiodinium necroappetens TaxID=1628268 RepID=A0A812LRQ7_9DINO|nr:unnamed protein product [Symbiodinium necroappetens]
MRVRLMHGILCCCDEGSSAAVFFRPDGRALKMKVTPAALTLIRALSDVPQRIRDLPCRDAFERLCVLEVLRDAGAGAPGKRKRA